MILSLPQAASGSTVSGSTCFSFPIAASGSIRSSLTLTTSGSTCFLNQLFLALLTEVKVLVWRHYPHRFIRYPLKKKQSFSLHTWSEESVFIKLAKRKQAVKPTAWN